MTRTGQRKLLKWRRIRDADSHLRKRKESTAHDKGIDKHRRIVFAEKTKGCLEQKILFLKERVNKQTEVKHTPAHAQGTEGVEDGTLPLASHLCQV